VRQYDELRTGLSPPTEIRTTNSVIQYRLTGPGEKSSINRHQRVRRAELWPPAISLWLRCEHL